MKDIAAGNITLPAIMELSPEEKQLHTAKKQALAELRAVQVLVLDNGCRRALQLATDKLAERAGEADETCEHGQTMIGARVRELMRRFA